MLLLPMGQRASTRVGERGMLLLLMGQRASTRVHGREGGVIVAHGTKGVGERVVLLLLMGWERGGFYFCSWPLVELCHCQSIILVL